MSPKLSSSSTLNFVIYYSRTVEHTSNNDVFEVADGVLLEDQDEVVRRKVIELRRMNRDQVSQLGEVLNIDLADERRLVQHSLRGRAQIDIQMIVIVSTVMYVTLL